MDFGKDYAARATRSKCWVIVSSIPNLFLLKILILAVILAFLNRVRKYKKTGPEILISFKNFQLSSKILNFFDKCGI